MWYICHEDEEYAMNFEFEFDTDELLEKYGDGQKELDI